ncbi:hypothetical protein ACT3N8_10450 [Psychrobacter aquimaris]|uniref:hypothetical protein n=1 Tax=Psychrobacter TaxID=497 RepID=UPI003FD0A43C
MKKEFLNLDEFMALLASHGYEWGSTETTNLLLEAFYSEGITPVFFYDGIIGWGYSYWDGTLDEWVRVKEGFSTLRGYFSIHQSDLIEHYRDMESIKEKWYFGSRIRAYKTYGEPPPTLSDNDTSFGYNSRIELGKQAPLSELEKIEHCYIYIYDDDYQLAFNELLYPIEQVEKILTPLTPDDTATPAQLASLTHEINEAKAIIAQQKERIAELEQAQASQPNEELHPKTLKTVSHLLNVLFDKARFDIDAHMGTTNSQIVELSNKLNTPITKKPVSYWIKQVKQLRIDKNIG